MKTYTQLKEEAIQLDEIFGLFGNRQTRDIDKRIKTAAQQGPEAEAKERLNIFRELIVNIKTLNNLKGKSIKLLNFGVSIKIDL